MSAVKVPLQAINVSVLFTAGFFVGTLVSNQRFNNKNYNVLEIFTRKQNVWVVRLSKTLYISSYDYFIQQFRIKKQRHSSTILILRFFCSDCAVKEPAPFAKDDEAARKLWDLSMKMTKLI